MIAIFDHQEVAMMQPANLAEGGMSDLEQHLDKILRGRHALEVAESLMVDNAYSTSQAVLRAYGEALKRAIPGIVRDQLLLDTSVLPHEKEVIKNALVDCLNFGRLAPSDIQALGDLYVYLSYFVDDLERKDKAPGVDLWGLHRVEKATLIAEWRKAVAVRKPSKISLLFRTRWKPDA